MSQPDHVITTIHHDGEDRAYVTGYQDSGSYLRRLTYHGSSQEQLKALTSTSFHCQQHIKVNTLKRSFLLRRFQQVFCIFNCIG